MKDKRICVVCPVCGAVRVKAKTFTPFCAGIAHFAQNLRRMFVQSAYCNRCADMVL